MRCVVDLVFKIHIARGVVRSCGPSCRPDCQDEGGRDEERRPHLGPIGFIFETADFQSHDLPRRVYYRRRKDEPVCRFAK